MRKTLLQLLLFCYQLWGIQNPFLAQKKTPLNQVVNTLKERISLSGYAQLGYTYDDAANRTIHSTSNKLFWAWHTEDHQTVDL